MNMGDWDTIYAVRVEVANKALGGAMSELIGSMQHTVAGALGTYAISVVFGAWQIVVGGSGQLVDLEVPITEGSITPEGKDPSSLGGYVVQFRLSLSLLSTGADGMALVFNAQRAGTHGQTPEPGLVVPIGYVGAAPDPSVSTLVLNVLAAGLAAESAALRFAFASISLVPPLTNSWLAPKNLAYAFVAAQTGPAYLALLSTPGDPSTLSADVDPELTKCGTDAAYAFSLPLFFKNCVIPSTASTLPDNPVNNFEVKDGSPPTIVLSRTVSLDKVKVAAITYHPKMKSFVAKPAYNELQISASGECDVYAGLTMKWSSTTTYAFSFDETGQVIGFSSTGKPSVEHDVKIPWYEVALAPGIAAIADSIASLIGNQIASSIGGDIGESLMAAAPPTSVQFSGAEPLTVKAATLDGAVILTGVF